jgi:putative heme-binding domain-containing protein
MSVRFFRATEPRLTRVTFALMTAALLAADDAKPPSASGPFARKNLVAWCIVPFDSKQRTPEQRAEMLDRLGIKRLAYDWRAEHVPMFDQEMETLRKHGITLQAFWVAPGELNDQSRHILDLLKRHGLKTQLWALLDLGPDNPEGAEQQRRVEAAAAKLKPLAEQAAKIGCTVGLYNHGGWFGEPENQIAIIERLKAEGITNLGIVYNLHHGHDHLDRFSQLLAKMMPYLLALNLNGMDPGGDRVGRKILPLGQGSLDLTILKTIRDSGYQGPIGILGHTQDDAEDRLRDNLDGLDWLVPQLDGKPPGPKPVPRTPVPARPPERPRAAAEQGEAAIIAELIHAARTDGDPRRGAEVFASPRFACLSCHRVGMQGGTVGPDLTTVGLCAKPEEIVESVLWPKRKVKEGFAAVNVALIDGSIRQGYLIEQDARRIALRDPTIGERIELVRAEIEEIREAGTLMPEEIAAAMTPAERRDLVRFLLDLGQPGGRAAEALAHQAHVPAEFPYDRAPLHPEHWPSWRHHVNRDRLYDFYAKEADYFRGRSPLPALLPPFPGLDGGKEGHWGNQNEAVWVDARWNDADIGNLICGVFRGAGVTVPKAVCVRLGERGELAACFDPETLTYPALWRNGFVKFSPTRHGFVDGLILDGEPLPRPEGTKPDQPFVYRGFYRHGRRVVFAYRLGGVEMLDAPWVDESGNFQRIVAPANEHPLRSLTHGGGPPRWPEILHTKGTLGDTGSPYVVDTIEPPFANPWKAPLFFGDHDFLPDGTALLCTMQGDVWRVEGLDETLHDVRWRRIASGLHQALGLVVANGETYVLGRDQITRLRDLDGDGEADFHECINNAYITSPAGHDFICGLQRDVAGRFFTASGNQGLLRIGPDQKTVDVIATGFRNPDGLGLLPDGTITVPCSEGEWTPASMICEVRPGGHYGYLGPKDGRPPDLPLAYLPRGMDNSSGGQVFVESDRFGPLNNQLLHFSFGQGSWFLVLRDQVDGQPQGAIVPLPGEFRSGAHRGRFHPKDGQLYVSGMAGWGSYTPDDGCFQRIRYTGKPAQLPIAYRAHENGVSLTFSLPLDPQVTASAASHFAQAWNYRYSAGYGSPELSPSHPGVAGHDPVPIRSAHVLDDGRTLFLELPTLQPVNQLHLRVRPDAAMALDVIATVHKLAPPWTGLPGYHPEPKTIAAHPILADMAALAIKPEPNPWQAEIAGARRITMEAGKNLSFVTRSFTVRAGEPIRLTLHNPDVVPHNWALVRPGALARVGTLANKLIAQPDAALRHYVPSSDDVLVYTDIVPPSEDFTISFRAPAEPGRYPYLCTFPGHWMVMNGEMVVK